MERRPGTPSLLRELNDRAALDLLLPGTLLTRTQISEKTRVSKVTVAQMLGRLEERGLVTVVGQQEGRRGPSAALYSVVPSSAYVAGLYVELDGVSVGVADVTGRVVAEVPASSCSEATSAWRAAPPSPAGSRPRWPVSAQPAPASSPPASPPPRSCAAPCSPSLTRPARTCSTPFDGPPPARPGIRAPPCPGIRAPPVPAPCRLRPRPSRHRFTGPVNCDRSLRAGTPLGLFTRAGRPPWRGTPPAGQVIVWQQARPL